MLFYSLMDRSPMMRLATIASFLVLHCNLFDMITAVDDDLYVMEDVTSMIGDLQNSCVFGVKSVSVVLYTSNIPNGKIIPNYDVMKEFCNLIDSTKPVFFTTHGFLANSQNYNFSDLASVLLKKDYTVFSTDWSNASCYNDPNIINLLEYPAAVYNVRDVGRYLANYTKSVIDECHVPLINIAFMGHSLGAHISSFAAKELQVLPKYGKIPLLIGTDPASPLFELRTCNNRFCKSDAERVIALHTSALGLQVSLGHCDLWFNNGFSQPACGGALIGSLNVNCSHNIAIVYLITIIDNYEYVGIPVPFRTIPIPRVFGCSSDTTNCIVVDNKIFDRNSSTVGDYCVHVTSEYPYGTSKDFSCIKNI